MNPARSFVWTFAVVAALASLVRAEEPQDTTAVEHPVARPSRIAMTRMLVPDDMENSGPVRFKFENHLAGQLRAAGFSVIPPDSFESLKAAVTDSMGGYFDPETGEVDSTRHDAVDKAVLRAAGERLGAQGILASALVVVPAWVQGHHARWHGAKESCGASASGEIPAYSVYVWLEAPDGTALHSGAGGIQLARKFGMKSFLDHSMVLKDVKRKDLFTKEEKNLRAVRMALTPYAASEKTED
jgi:hypothetical protein